MRWWCLCLMVACSGGNVDDVTDSTSSPDVPAPTPGELEPPFALLDENLQNVPRVTWEQSVAEDVRVEYSFDDGVWMSTPEAPAQVGRNTRVLMGIPYDATVQWRVVGPSGTQEIPDPIVTAAPPEGLPIGVLKVSDASKYLAEGQYLLSSINDRSNGWGGGNYWTFIVDRQGRPVWARSIRARHWTLFPQLSERGDHILWDEQTYWSAFDDGLESKIHRQYLDVYEPFETIDAPGVHHPFLELPDGTLAWASTAHGGGEALVELRPGETEVVELWNCVDDWPGVGSGCSSNSMWYDPKQDSYLLSFFSNSSVVHVDRKTGASLWWAGNVPNGYAFDPASSKFEWQHGVSWTPSGTFMVSTESRGQPLTTLVREYEVDTVNGVLRQVWSYDAGVHARYNGDALRLPNGNTLHTLGSASQFHEVDAEGNVVWLLDFESQRQVGHAEFLEDLYDYVSPEYRR